MSRKAQRKRRQRRPRLQSSRPRPEQLLVTMGTDSGDGPCDCPICRIMGIDLSQGDGVDVRPIDAEQLALLEAFFASGGVTH